MFYHALLIANFNCLSLTFLLTMFHTKGNNNLQGGIPPELIHLPDLGVLSLYNNKLSGEVPNDFKHLPKMSKSTIGSHLV